MTIEDACDKTLAMLAVRARHATVCPSEVARAMMADHASTRAAGWRDAMPTVHAAVDRLVAEGHVQLSWKGEPLATRAGPYRIRRGART